MSTRASRTISVCYLLSPESARRSLDVRLTLAGTGLLFRFLARWLSYGLQLSQFLGINLDRELQPFTGNGRCLFPSLRTTERRISDVTLNAALRRL
jgi:hypothetical protein